MVNLTMTEAIVAALQYSCENKLQRFLEEGNGHEPAIQDPAIGKPISHIQVISLSRCLQNHFQNDKSATLSTTDAPCAYHLDALLRGSRVHVEAPKPKPEPVSHLIVGKLVKSVQY